MLLEVSEPWFESISLVHNSSLSAAQWFVGKRFMQVVSPRGSFGENAEISRPCSTWRGAMGKHGPVNPPGRRFAAGPNGVVVARAKVKKSFSARSQIRGPERPFRLPAPPYPTSCRPNPQTKGCGPGHRHSRHNNYRVRYSSFQGNSHGSYAC